ncbi:hypothetical protein CC85DRAFT_256134 [Cutaneotrichosporon oleaginosum]|uniref:MYND-type domain-containing protein n=1 Tax=Cutaneotrichosporon oleaginosum TaxID=879819 RepID=A0A0J0XVR6_9TREE|nr:uncharacterized protein CC85DRAFT_256134 [Cutaneotrichosporon oleaginosum]KLT45123.1 hypothetical protein CC85DRAFT_256134 [Cutaneotrichosporon oleaginosum]TXT09803.1 hypothetical protein COLE_03737 [Cutaneotrichosporon oleaginosum]
MTATEAAPTATPEAVKPEAAASSLVADDSLSDEELHAPSAAAKKKKKKKPKKKKKAIGGVPPETVPVLAETAEEAQRWEAQLVRGAKMFSLPPWLLNDSEREKLNTFRTPACAGFALRTPRLVLRQVGLGDTTAIRRIKMEPVVQKTQLYGSPAAADIRDSFQRRYVASSIPALDRGGAWRDEWVFAITAKDPPSLKLAPGTNLRITNRLKDAEGYLGNFALSISTHPHAPSLGPRRGEVYTHPSFADTAAAALEGKLFYELHPQLWGQGLASEAFAEVLRFAFEEVGCTRVSADPTTTAEASIALCKKFGLNFVRQEKNNAGKPQLFHEITRGEWFKKFRGIEGKIVAGASAKMASNGDTHKHSHEHEHGEDCEHDHDHDHDHDHGHGHEHGDDCAHDHDHDHNHSHAKAHDHPHKHHHGYKHGHEHGHGGCDHDHPPPLPPSATVDVGPGPWAGKEVCRWCTDFRTRPVITCKCGWAKYCSRECQRADWVWRGGHQGQCDAQTGVQNADGE